MDPTLKRTTVVFRALAHPCRLRLLLALSKGQLCDVTTLIGACGQRQPYVSQQLRVLRESGLVVGEKHGQRICYQLANPQVAEVLVAIGLLDQPTSDCGHDILSTEALGSQPLLASEAPQGTAVTAGNGTGWGVEQAGGAAVPALARDVELQLAK